MKALIVSSRSPWPSHTGDRVRATIWIAALREVAEVTLVAPRSGWEPAAGVRHYAPLRSPMALVSAMVRSASGNQPVQTILASVYDWREALGRAHTERGPFDATIVLLSRFDPLVSDLGGGRRILDAIDSLRRSMAERRRSANPLVRFLWAREERSLASIERRAVTRYDRIIVTSASDAEEFGGAASVLSSGVEVRPLDLSSPRRFDFGFWGRLAYFANRDAVRELLGIWPIIRAAHPTATLVIGGADAPREIRNCSGREGISVISPIEDVAAFARQVRIALFPVRFGTGVSTKVLEAAEGGCAIAASAIAVRGLEPIAAHALVESDPSALAVVAAELCGDECRRRALAAEGRRVVESELDRRRTLDEMRAIAFGKETRA